MVFNLPITLLTYCVNEYKAKFMAKASILSFKISLFMHAENALERRSVTVVVELRSKIENMKTAFKLCVNHGMSEVLSAWNQRFFYCH